MYLLLLFSMVIGMTSSLNVVKQNHYIEDEGWHMWKATHGKTYLDLGEEKVRYAIWKDNFRRIVEYNQRSEDVTLGMNKFGDMTNTEFRAKMTGMFGKKHEKTGSTFLAPEHVELPASVDWRTKGMVTPIKDQGQCGSCWAFSATGSLEGQQQKKSGQLVSLSEQQLVDCSTKFGDYGCNGGLPDNAFAYVKANGGLDTEASYPYKAKDDKCHFNKKTIGANVTGHVDIQQGNETALQVASATIGPISVGIDASHFSFQFYKKGVYYSWLCSSTNLDHGVLVAGYGVDNATGKKYWLVKNSWGTSWGQKGYIWMARDRNNNCGIATLASYPLV